MSPLIKSKAASLVLGVFVGFLLGGSVVWWYAVVNHGDWVFRHQMGQFFNRLFEHENDDISKAEEGSQKYPKTAGKTNRGLSGRQIDENISDTLDINDSLQGGFDYTDRRNLKQNSLSVDSLPDDSMKYHAPDIDPYRNIIVVKDELLFAKSIKVSALDSLARAGHLLDSLLIGDNNPVKNPKNLFRLEFWRSPVNYKGYKMSNNKVVLFGIYDFENTYLQYIDDEFYLKSKEDYYKIEATEDFLPLIKIKKPI